MDSSNAKLVSYTVMDLSTEAELEFFISYWEKYASEYVSLLKTKGLIRWRLNRIWNKEGKFTLSQIYEYRDAEAFKECQAFMDEHFEKEEHRKFFSKINVILTTSRAITLLDSDELNLS